MKCPKCGYNSFEFLDTCKKCGTEFISFKKNHRISPVILTSSVALEVKTTQVKPVSSAAGGPLVVAGTNPEGNGDEFFWETLDEPPTTKQEESTYSGSDLNIEDSVDTGMKDKAFTGFTFSDEQTVQQPVQASIPEGGLHDDFSFEDSTGEESVTSTLEVKLEESDSGLEGYERLFELDSAGETDVFAGGVKDTGMGKDGDLEMDDFSFSKEPVLDDILKMEGNTVTAAPAVKKTQPNLGDFEKEFLQIFSLGDTEEENTRC